jgi:hypothetical protein
MPSDVTIDHEGEGPKGTLGRIRHSVATGLKRARPQRVAASSRSVNRMTAVHLTIAFVALFI